MMVGSKEKMPVVVVKKDEIDVPVGEAKG